MIEVAREISETMSKAWNLPELDIEGEITLAETLVDLGDQGYKVRLFHSENRAPSIAVTNKKIDKIVGLISKLQKALDDESASGLEAKKVLASCLVQTAAPERGTSPLESGNWIYQAKHVAERLSAIDPKYRPKDQRYPSTGMHFQTYLTGAALPDLFCELYGADQFGSHNHQNDYNCAGIKFVLECSIVLGFDDITQTSISKNRQRAQGKFHNDFDEYYAFLEDSFYNR